MAIEYIWSDKKRILGLRISLTKYSLTSDRLFKEVGLLAKKEDQTQLYKVSDISLKRGFLQRIFGLGTIELITSDPSNPVILIENISKAREVSELINDLVNKEKQEKNVIFYESQPRI